MTDNTLVTFLLDRTGSMSKIRDATIEAFNAYLTELQQSPDSIDFTLLQFDTESLDKLYVAVPVNDVPLLNYDTFVPRGGTPLIDAGVKTIKAVEDAIARSGGKPKVVVCIQTDGEENASTEHTLEELRGLITARAAEGWQFNFMGAGINAYTQGAAMGLPSGQTMSYDAADLVATRHAFRASAANARMYAAGVAASTSYSNEQKAASGDVYAPELQPASGALPPTGLGVTLGQTTAAQLAQKLGKVPAEARVKPRDPVTGRAKTVEDFSL